MTTIASDQVLPRLFTYWMDVKEVHDGDTITVEWDLGRSIVLRDEKIRLLGINAPEVNKPEQVQAGLLARDFLRALILGKRVVVQTKKDSKEKFGRFLGTVYLSQADGSFIDVNELMVASGHAVRFMVSDNEPTREVIVNGTHIEVVVDTLSYDDAVILAGKAPGPGYTITYQTKAGSGHLTDGKTIKVHGRVVLNVAMTNNS